MTDERFWELAGMEIIRRAQEEAREAAAKPRPIIVPGRVDEEQWPPEHRPAWADALMRGMLH
jgi:hypothetical protein